MLDEINAALRKAAGNLHFSDPTFRILVLAIGDAFCP
jgi:hypothetical protein